MHKPNFFILGAPKCGTTSLAAWLAENPNIFVSKVKEPHYFNTDDRQGVATLGAYELLFREATDQHVAVGEASVWYLSSTEAVRNILRYQAEARFIVMVRNPVEMAPALHGEMLLSGHESVRDLRAAWDLQAERREGRLLPAFSWARRRFLYHSAPNSSGCSRTSPQAVFSLLCSTTSPTIRGGNTCEYCSSSA